MNELQKVVHEQLPTLKQILSLNAKEGIDVETLALQEMEHLNSHLLTKPELLECLPQSVIMAVRSVMKQNLTLDPYAGLVYVKTRNIKINNVWKKALEIQPSANGLISIARQCGRLLDIKRPEVEYDANKKVIKVYVDLLLPSVPQPRWERITFDESDFYRWQRASHKENSRNKQDADNEKLNYANDNYTNWKGGIDPEFARAKAIRHGLKKLGTNPNEIVMKQITIEPKTIYIDVEKDKEADTDEQTVQQTQVLETKLSKLPNESEL